MIFRVCILFLSVLLAASCQSPSADPFEPIEGSYTLCSGDQIPPPAGDAESLYTLLYAVPAQAGDGLDKGASFSISARAETPSAEGLPEKTQDQSERFHFNLRKKEEMLLSEPQEPMPEEQGIAFHVGDIWTDIMLLSVVDDESYETIDARCAAVSPHAFFFVQEGRDASLLPLNEYIAAFEQKYAVMLEKFGSPSDIDANGRVIFLFASFDDEDTGGFFNPFDKSLSEEYSNHSDILYLNYDTACDQSYKTYILASLFHELQHMILYDYRASRNYEETALWINEGLSKLAEYYTGYAGDPDEEASHYEFIRDFMSEHYLYSLIDFEDATSYGYSLFFMRYLQERFGDGFIRGIYDSPHAGVQAVADATGIDFNELYRDFVYMILVTGRHMSADPRYDIPGFNTSPSDPDFEGFPVPLIIDEVYGDPDSPLVFETGYLYAPVRLKPYSFCLIKWKGNVSLLRLKTRGNIRGFAVVLP